MQVPDEAVQAALARRADLLSDRPDPTALSEERLVRLMLEAAAPILAEAWGVKPRKPRPLPPVLLVPCPQCRAAAGERCRSRIPGSKLHYGPAASHGARVDAMREAEKVARGEH